MIGLQIATQGYGGYVNGLGIAVQGYASNYLVWGVLDLFNPQLKSLKQEYQLENLKQKGQIKWLQ